MAAIATTRLLQSPRPVGAESIASHLSRLSWANGFYNADEFCKITSFSRHALVRMPASDAARLSEWTGLPTSVFETFAMRPGAVIPFGSGLVKRTQLQTVGVRYCPACIKQDFREGTPHIRAHWHWRMVAHCPQHLCALELDKRGILHATSLEEFAYEPDTAVDSEKVTSDRYFVDRLIKPAGDAFLDQYPAYVAAEFCTLVGHFIASLRSGFGKERIPDGYENAKLRQLGYEAASQGRDAVWQVMTDYVEKGGMWGYSPVLRWASVNKYDPAYTALLRLFQSHAEESIPLEPGETFIWPITKRKVYTVGTASREYGISEARVKRALSAAMRVETLPRFLKRDEIHATLLEATSYVTTSDAAAAFGCSLEVCDDIIKKDLIAVVPNRDYEGRVYRLVHKNEVEIFLQKLEELVDRSISTDGLMTLNKVFRPTVTGMGTILELALNKKIVRITCAEQKADLKTLLFDPAEIRKAAREMRQVAERSEMTFESELIDLQAARRRLGVGKTTMEELIGTGIIPSEELSDGSAKLSVRTRDLDVFAANYVSAGQLASVRKVTPVEVTANLTAHGVWPVTETWFKSDWFYRKSDIAALEVQ